MAHWETGFINFLSLVGPIANFLKAGHLFSGCPRLTDMPGQLSSSMMSRTQPLRVRLHFFSFLFSGGYGVGVPYTLLENFGRGEKNFWVAHGMEGINAIGEDTRMRNFFWVARSSSFLLCTTGDRFDAIIPLPCLFWSGASIRGVIRRRFFVTVITRLMAFRR